MEEEEIIQDEVYENPVQLEEEQEETQTPQEPIVVETKGKWGKVEYLTGQTFEVGKTYKIKVGGECKFAISKNTPTTGFKTNEIEYTKEKDIYLWIMTK